MGKWNKFLCEVKEVLDSYWSLVINGKGAKKDAKSSRNKKKKIKKNQ